MHLEEVPRLPLVHHPLVIFVTILWETRIRERVRVRGETKAHNLARVMGAMV